MILSWNVCGLGYSSKRKAISKYIKDFNVIVCFIIESKLSCSDSIVSNMWHGQNIKWFYIEAQGRSDGLLAMWDDDLFRVDSVEFAGSWISLFGSFIDDAFDCVITGYYGAGSRSERAASWMELTELRHAFSNYPWFLIGDFNETLSKADRSSDLLDRRGASEFQAFIDGCELVEYPLVNHRFNWFRGSSMNRLDRAFAHTQCLSHFSSLKLIRLDHGLSDHCPILVGKEQVNWGWKPFKCLDCWLMAPSFHSILKVFWKEIMNDIPGDFQVIRRINALRLKLDQWNKTEFGNQDWALQNIQSSIRLLED